jgi:4-amino-4-deoxy-L-arabinose transferase-like glycosyltransferase
MSSVAARVRGDADSRELSIVAIAAIVSTALVVVYAIARDPLPLVGDQIEYHAQGVLFTQGHWWWSEAPFGVLHPSAWKAPLYPAWVGFWYEIFGAKTVAIGLVQAPFAGLTVIGTWALGRRLFGAPTAMAAACVIAILPLGWEFFGLLYSEALAIPATLGVLLLFLGLGPPSNARIAAVGGAMGVALLIRPSSVFLFAGLLAAWIVACGWKRGIGATALAVLAAALVVAPWTLRNALTDDVGFLPLSVQDGAAYGTFNDTAANDPVNPYAWRAIIDDMPAVLEGPPVPDSEVRSELQAAARDYIVDHPASLAEAFFWNGLSRLWDVRRPARALDEVPFEGRSKAVTEIGLYLYYPLLVLALIAIWRIRRRRDLLIPILALALAAALVYTSASGTRYRAPLEPLIAILAASCVLPRTVPHRARPSGVAQASVAQDVE